MTVIAFMCFPCTIFNKIRHIVLKSSIACHYVNFWQYVLNWKQTLNANVISTRSKIKEEAISVTTRETIKEKLDT